MKSFEHAEAPSDLPASKSRECWKADYAGPATAQVLICGYGMGGAFDAMQRAPAEANTVKFQEGNYLVIVKWNGASRTDVTALVRSIQKTLHTE